MQNKINSKMINNRKSPIQNDYIEKYLAEKELNLTATLEAKTAYAHADFVVIAAPTMSGLQTVLMLHGRKEPVLYTQHSAMMLHNALKYESKTAVEYTI